MTGKRIPGTNPGFGPPSWRAGIGELATPLELVRLALRWPTLPAGRTGGRSTVLLVPGFGAADGSLFALHRYLERRDFEVVPWGLGRNHGDVPQLMPVLAERVRTLARECREPVALVGWSLGGYLAREAARDEPASVRHVVTIGSPIVGGPKYTTVAPYYRRKGIDVDEIEREVAERYRVPLRVPVTAIYSRRDGVVAWRACIDEWSPNVEHIRVGSTHVGLGFSPDVLEIVADRLKPAARGQAPSQDLQNRGKKHVGSSQAARPANVRS